MFGFSFAELILVLLVVIIFIKPQDLPEIAHFIGKIYYKLRKLISDLKIEFKKIEKDIGFEEIKSELNRGIAEEKLKIEESKEEFAEIIDLYGNPHQVKLKSLANKNLEEIKMEIEKYNKINNQN